MKTKEAAVEDVAQKEKEVVERFDVDRVMALYWIRIGDSTLLWDVFMHLTMKAYRARAIYSL